MPGMAGNRTKKRRREEQPSALDLLLDDPAALHAANEAFALAEWPDAESWPFVASVGLETVALRWTGESSIPLPITPWRAGSRRGLPVIRIGPIPGSSASACKVYRGRLSWRPRSVSSDAGRIAHAPPSSVSSPIIRAWWRAHH